MSQNCLLFFIGTEAELIKVFPVMMLAEKSGMTVKVVSSGQNDISKSTVLRYANGGRVDLKLSEESAIEKTTSGVFRWFFGTMNRSKKPLKEYVTSLDSPNPIMVVHGDTVSTVMGARLARQLGLRVAHIEAGLRSHNYLNPFPEEIDRAITSKLADFHFAPGEGACHNLRNARGQVFNTVYNTVIDSLAHAKKRPCEDDAIIALEKQKYFVSVLHRQENLGNSALVNGVVDRIIALCENTTGVFILHAPTETALRNYGLLEKLYAAKGLTVLKRREYFDFTRLLLGAQYVVTDGGSNQEELSYMGKPCLIIRKHTERMNGIGENAKLFSSLDDILDFGKSYGDFIRPETLAEHSPSQRIIEVLSSN